MRQHLYRFGSPIALAILVSVAGSPAIASDRGNVTDSEQSILVPISASGDTDWGTTTTTHLTVPAYGFASRDDSPQNLSGYNRFSPTGQEVEAPVYLPSGASVTGVQLQGCDTNAAGEVVFIMFTVNDSGVFTLVSSLGTTGLAATPGCGRFTINVSPAHTVSTGNTYYVAVRSGTTNTTNYTAIRVFYRLQVSAAPAVATFPNDVPTSHPFFRFVEAMAASGLTGGCAAGSFCPDSPVTRGQMAVFMASALGLHFAP